MAEPLGYRILARRLARDLAACHEADAIASGRRRGQTIDGDDYDRRFARAAQTLRRFRAYERTHKGRRTL